MPVRFYNSLGTMFVDHGGGNIREITTGEFVDRNIGNVFYVTSIVNGVSDDVIYNIPFDQIQDVQGDPAGADVIQVQAYINQEITSWKNEGGGGGIPPGPGNDSRNFLGNVDTIVDANSLLPQNGDYIHNNETGTIFTYDGMAWNDSGSAFSRTPNRSPIITDPPITLQGAWTNIGTAYQALNDDSVQSVSSLSTNGNGVEFDLSSIGTSTARLYVGEWTGAAANERVENSGNWRFAIQIRRQGANFRIQNLVNTNTPTLTGITPTMPISFIRVNETQVEIQVMGFVAGQTISGKSGPITIALAVRDTSELIPINYASV